MKPQFNSQFENENSCPCCERHCPIDNLHCSRGKSYFGQETDQSQRHSEHSERSHHSKGKFHEKSNMNNIKDETIRLMMQCGHLLHHNSDKFIENEDILSFLSADEKDELNTILKKCIEYWNNK